MAQVTCGACHGTGSVASQLNPYGYKTSAGMGKDVCRACGGSGRVRGGLAVDGEGGSRFGSVGPGSHTRVPISVWLFVILGAFVGGSLLPFGLNGLFGAILGFLVFALTGGILHNFRVGRIVLRILGVGFVGAFIVAIVVAALSERG